MARDARAAQANAHIALGSRHLPCLLMPVFEFHIVASFAND